LVLACDFRIEAALDRMFSDGRKEIEEVLEDYGDLELELQDKRWNNRDRW
jgi:hypothetical protein